MSRHHAALVVSCIGIAIAPILVRMSEVDPSTTLWLRMLMASALLAATTRWSGGDRKRARSEGLSCLLAAASLAFALDLLCFHLAVVRTSVANTALLGNISPVIVAPMAYLFFGERQTPQAITGLAIAFGGLILLVNAGYTPNIDGRHVIGDGLAALSGGLYALYVLLCKKLSGRVGPDRIMVWNCVVTAAVLTPIVAYDGGIHLPHSITGWLVIVGMAVGCQVLGHGMLVYAMAAVPASFASIALLAAPAVSAATAWIVFGETLTLTQVFGSATVLAGLGAVSLGEAQRGMLGHEPVEAAIGRMIDPRSGRLGTK